MLMLPGYQIQDVVYRGQRSILYRAFGERERGTVVVKTTSEHYPLPAEVAALEHEYQVAKDLNLPGVVRHRGLIPCAKTFVLIIEDFGARSLAAWVAERGPLEIAVFLDVAQALAEALGSIHDHRIIHKDICPNNILYNPATGAAKICDFGTASLLQREKQEFNSLGIAEGTLAYIAPEQTGRMNRTIGSRADLYSLGATFYHLLVGSPPFTAEDPVEMVHCHIAKTPAPPHGARPDIPEQVSSFVLKLLAKNAEDRYQTAYALQADLAECARRLRDTGRIDAFPLGRDDLARALQISEKLYGREEQVAALLSAFERTTSGKGEIVLVGGYSGVGKSVLVREVHRPIATRRGYFVRGKCDQVGAHAPLSAFAQALADLARQVLTESEARLLYFQERLREALGQNGRLLVDFVPELETVIGAQPPVIELPPLEARDRFEGALIRFLLAFAGADHPLVLFIDDLQWIDPESIRLWTHLATRPDACHLMLIGAYRDNEVAPAHPVMVAARELEQAGVAVQHIRLRPLDVDNVVSLISDTLHSDAETTRPLAELVIEKTEGNPFFLTHLLYLLHDEGSLRFNQGARRWVWDVEHIRWMGISDNVVDLMLVKMNRYPEASQELIRLASCLGGTFDLGTLSTVSGASPHEVAQGLWKAVQDGLLLPLDAAHHYYHLWSEHAREGGLPADEVRYRFAHDRIQEAAYSHIPAERRPEVSLRIGRLLLTKLTPEQRPERLFDVVLHLNEGSGLMTSSEEKTELARLNLAAGRRAMAAIAYHAAADHLRRGVALLGADGWDRQHELMFGLHRELTECEYLRGNPARADELFAVASARARTREHLGDIYQLMIRMCHGTKSAEGLRLGQQCLRLFGVDLPDDPGLAGALIAEKTAELTRLIAEREIHELIHLPTMRDPDVAVCLAVLHETWSCAVLTGNLVQVMLTSLHMMTLSLAHGHCEYSPCGYVAYGGVLVAQGEFQRAYAFGRLAVDLCQRFKNALVIPKVNNTFCNFINHFINHVATSVALYAESYQYALQSGDRVWGAWAVGWIRTARFIKGDLLQEVYDTGELYRSYIDDSGYPVLLHKLEIEQHVVLCLQGRTEGRFSLSRGEFREEEAVEALVHLGFGWLVHWYRVLKGLLHYLYDDHAQAREHSAQAHELRDSVPNAMTCSDHFFCRSLILAAACSEASREERAGYLEEIREHCDRMRVWAEHGPDNHRHKLLLMKAELDRVEGRSAEAADLYEHAIGAARRSGYLHHEALANELAGKHYLEQGRPGAAKGYLFEARYLYHRWGAAAKVAQLSERYAHLLALPRLWSPSAPMNGERTASSRFGAEQIDLATVIKAALALSGEIMLGRLLERVVSIGIENAGAMRGVLMLERDGRLLVEAAASAGSEKPSRLSISVEESEDLPRSVIYYVRRTGRSLALDDAASDAHFQADPYIAARGVRSILCLPAMRQAKLLGILYLENNLVRGAFTSERMRVLQVLATQAAISLENALLYDTLEQRVEDRTRELIRKNDELAGALRELRDTQDRLIVQSRLAALGSLTAGIAHELRNPLNFVNNFSEISLERVEELLGELKKSSAHLGPDTLSYVDALGVEIKESLSRVVAHGKRAAGIISAMLLHARGSTGELREVDLNALLRESVHLAYQGMRSRDPSFHVALRLHLDESLDRLKVAPQEIARVFLNLIDNACYAARAKSNEAGASFSPEIVAKTRDLGEHVEIRIHDNGAGIPSDVRGRVFDPFFTTKSAGEGTGLGLSISREIVEQGNGGVLRFETEEGSFTEFIITLPKR
ncbi:trifunctional serine/threonine-protein kinase/ATP-binding protein/sensor histidine kinase [Sorangium sp. So ce1151]|uniref:trifunctional serine/threonine-protein kinase/ATP-binding protein/sensor histidine kinase n=1 Tax=Sorangium sp. So ce1151 TaxID=3133332 RepID=UPI003F60B8EB